MKTLVILAVLNLVALALVAPAATLAGVFCLFLGAGALLGCVGTGYLVGRGIVAALDVVTRPVGGNGAND